MQEYNKNVYPYQLGIKFPCLLKEKKIYLFMEGKIVDAVILQIDNRAEIF